MLVTLEEMKNYLRVDFEDDDALIGALITSAQRICMDIIRTEDIEVFFACENAKAAVMATESKTAKQLLMKLLPHRFVSFTRII